VLCQISVIAESVSLSIAVGWLIFVVVTG